MPTASAAAAASAAFAWQQPQQPAAPDGFVSSVCHRRVLTAHFRRACQIAATFSCFTTQIPQRKTQRERGREKRGEGKAFTQAKPKRIVSLANYANVSSCSFMSFAAARKNFGATTTTRAEQQGNCHTEQCDVTSTQTFVIFLCTRNSFH